MKKKVLQLIYSFTMGGAQTLVKEYCLKLDKDKYDVSVVCFYRCGTPYESLLEEAGIKVVYIDDYENRKKNGHFKNAVSIVKRCLFLKKYIRDEKPDIIHSHLAVNSYVLFSTPMKGTKIVHTVHSEPKILWRNSFSRKLDLWAAHKLVKKYKMQFIVLHEQMKQEVNEMFGVKNSVVLNNGIDFTRFENVLPREVVRKREGIPEDAFVIGNIGRFGKQKNHIFLVDIFAKIREKNEHAFLLLVGTGVLKNEIEEKLNALGLKESYKILSNRDDIPELLNVMDEFVFPSIFEGLGIVLIEAQKMGIPCVISDTIPEKAIISNLITKVSLKETAEYWAEIILNHKVDEIKYNGLNEWDMTYVVKKLQQIYG